MIRRAIPQLGGFGSRVSRATVRPRHPGVPSFVDATTVALSVGGAAVIHAGCAALGAGRGVRIDGQILAATVLNCALMALLFLPVVAAARKRLRWDDFLILFSIFSFFEFCATIPVLLLTQRIRAAHMFTLQEALPFESMKSYFPLTGLVLLLFCMAVLVLNRSRLGETRPGAPSGEDRTALVLAGGVLSAVYAATFVVLFRNFGGYLLALGRMSQRTTWTREGYARYVILFQLGGFGPVLLALGMVKPGKGGASLLALRRLPVYAAFGFGLLSAVVLGGRAEPALYAYLCAVVSARAGLRPKLLDLAVLVGLIVAIWFPMTLVRENPYGWKGERNFVELLQEGSRVPGRWGQPVLSGLEAERYYVTTYIVWAFEDRPFLKGESLVAGFYNTVTRALPKLWGVRAEADPPLWRVANYLGLWLRGNPTMTHTPPSLPGELYANGGFILVPLGGLVSGATVKWLRRSQARSRGTLKTFLLTYLGIILIFTLSTETALLETSLLTSFLLMWFITWSSDKVTKTFSAATQRSFRPEPWRAARGAGPQKLPTAGSRF